MMLGVGVSATSSVGYLARNPLILRLSVGSVGICFYKANSLYWKLFL